MSFKFIQDFQINLYKILAENSELQKIVNNIYFSVVQDAKYPFLLINILKISNNSKFNQSIYDIEFEICIFARDKNNSILISIAKLIIAILEIKVATFEDYMIIGIKPSEITFNSSQDLVTHKMGIHYKTILRERI
jgi:hypothetical protein